MKKNKNIIKGKKGSMMMEYFILLVVGLIILAGFLVFLDSGSLFAEKSFKQIGKLQKTSDVKADLGDFTRIE